MLSGTTNYLYSKNLINRIVGINGYDYYDCRGDGWETKPISSILYWRGMGYAGNYDLCLDVSVLGIQGVIDVIDIYIQCHKIERNTKRGLRWNILNNAQLFWESPL